MIHLKPKPGKKITADAEVLQTPIEMGQNDWFFFATVYFSSSEYQNQEAMAK